MMDGVVREIGGEVVAGLADPRLNRARVAIEIGRPLVGLAAEEAIKVLEPESDRPLFEGAGRAVLIGRNVVVLAEPGGRIAVVPKDPADGGVLGTDDGIVTRIAGRQFADHAIADLMMVAPGDQRGSRRRAKGRRVELGEAQAGGCDAVERRRRYDAAERAGNAVTLIVGHDEQDVRRALRRHDARRPERRRSGGRLLDHAAKRHRRRRKLGAVNRHCRAGGAGCAGDLLRRSGRALPQCHESGQRDPATKPLAIHVPSFAAPVLSRLRSLVWRRSGDCRGSC